MSDPATRHPRNGLLARAPTRLAYSAWRRMHACRNSPGRADQQAAVTRNKVNDHAQPPHAANTTCLQHRSARLSGHLRRLCWGCLHLPGWAGRTCNARPRQALAGMCSRGPPPVPSTKTFTPDDSRIKQTPNAAPVHSYERCTGRMARTCRSCTVRQRML